VLMLATQIDGVLGDFVRHRVPFSHRDVAERIPNLPDSVLSLVRRYVYQSMQRIPSYRLSVAHFVGEGPTVMCVPRAASLHPTPPRLPVGDREAQRS